MQWALGSLPRSMTTTPHQVSKITLSLKQQDVYCSATNMQLHKPH